MARKIEFEQKFVNPCTNYIQDESCFGVECQPNQYPAYLEKPMPLAFVGTENGSYKSIYALFIASQKCADRTLLMTPWGNYAIFKVRTPYEGAHNTMFFLYDGCTCNPNSFRYLDLREGTAGFLSFYTVNSLITYVMNSRYRRLKLSQISKRLLDDICVEKRPTDGEDNLNKGGNTTM